VTSQEQASRWVYEYSDLLYRHALLRVQDADLAKDLVQDTFLSAWKNISQFHASSSAKTWLFAILKNKIIDHYRRAATRHSTSFEKSDVTQDIFFDGEEHWQKGQYPKQWTTQFKNLAETREFYTVLEKCKSKLRDIQLAVFSMKYIDDKDSDEICKELCITPSNYWVIMHRAKLQLRSCLEANWFAK